MGIRSWFRSHRFAGDPEEPAGSFEVEEDDQDQPHSLIRHRYEDPDFEEVQRAAAADVAAMEQEDKYFGRDASANRDEF